MTTLYGISNCDKVRAARHWLDREGIEHRFHDFREDGLDRELLQGWIDKLGLEALVNRRSRSWQQLSPAQKDAFTGEQAMELLLATPTLIKRPLLDTGRELQVGFSDKAYRAHFRQHTL